MCQFECVSTAGFLAHTGGLFYPNGDVEFTQRSYRCANPTSPYATVNINLDASAMAANLSGGISSGDVLDAVYAGASTWDNLSNVLLEFDVNDALPDDPSTHAGNINIVVPNAAEPVYPGSEINVLGVAEELVATESDRLMSIKIYRSYRDASGIVVPTNFTETGSLQTRSLGLIVSHEIGHALGIGHLIVSSNANDIMLEHVSVGSIHQLNDRTEYAISYLYPVSATPRQAAGTCGPPLGWL